MTDFNWTQYLVLAGVAILGSFAIIPYAFELNREKLAQSPLSRRQLMLVTAIQSVILFLVVTFLGLLATRAIGLSVTSPADSLPLAILLGLLSGSVVVLLEKYLFVPHMPEALHQAEKHIALWKRFTASLYGGVNEEILMRLLLMSGIAWLLGRVWQTGAGLPTDGVMWVAILLASVLFGIGHLPATAAITPLTPLIILRAIALNGIVGIVCGLLFWQNGLVAAMVAHFSADMVLHVIAPMMHRPPTDIDNPAMAQAPNQHSA